MFLLFDEDAPAPRPPTACLSGHLRVHVYLACSYPRMTGLVAVGFQFVSPHQILLHACHRAAGHITHVQPSTVGVSLTPWRLGLPALRDRLFPLRVLWLRGTMCPFTTVCFLCHYESSTPFPTSPIKIVSFVGSAHAVVTDPCKDIWPYICA